MFTFQSRLTAIFRVDRLGVEDEQNGLREVPVLLYVISQTYVIGVSPALRDQRTAVITRQKKERGTATASEYSGLASLLLSSILLVRCTDVYLN